MLYLCNRVYPSEYLQQIGKLEIFQIAKTTKQIYNISYDITHKHTLTAFCLSSVRSVEHRTNDLFFLWITFSPCYIRFTVKHMMMMVIALHFDGHGNCFEDCFRMEMRMMFHWNMDTNSVMKCISNLYMIWVRIVQAN